MGNWWPMAWMWFTGDIFLSARQLASPPPKKKKSLNFLYFSESNNLFTEFQGQAMRVHQLGAVIASSMLNMCVHMCDG